MYKLEYLPIALNDMIEIISYIRNELKNPTAANTLSEKFIQAAENSKDFPYSNPLYIPIRMSNHEYRKIIVDNYIMFYRVNETTKTITVARVIYGKCDYGRIIE